MEYTTRITIARDRLGNDGGTRLFEQLHALAPELGPAVSEDTDANTVTVLVTSDAPSITEAIVVAVGRVNTALAQIGAPTGTDVITATAAETTEVAA